MAGRNILQLGTRINIGNGWSTSIWSDPWVPEIYNFILPSPANWPVGIARVTDLIDHKVLACNHRVVKRLFTHR